MYECFYLAFAFLLLAISLGIIIALIEDFIKNIGEENK